MICKIKWFLSLIIISSFINGCPKIGDAQPLSPDSTRNKPEQVYLTFQYEGGINTVVLAFYWNNSFYLPVNSLFSILKINHAVNLNQKTVSGFYLNKSDHYQIDLLNKMALVGGKRISLSNKDFLIRKLDYYLRPKVYNELFGLHFAVNFNKLSLQLTTPDTLPVVKLYQQEQKKNNVSRIPIMVHNYPLEYKEKRSLLNGGFVDYSLNTNYGKYNSSYNLNLHGGAELLGGDIQGNIFSVYGNNGYNIDANSIRWRYVARTNPYIKSITLGNISSDNIVQLPITGIHVSNEPVNPRYIYGKYTFDGMAQPSSIVELYLNNQLIQFQKADELGRYHFSIPLTYGDSNLHLKIYGPNGNVTNWHKLVEVPYGFIPQNTINYNVRVGEIRNYYSLNYQNKKVVQTFVKYGISIWLSAQAGVDYINADTHSKPLPYGSLNARIATEYLLSANVIPNNLYQLKAQVTYPQLASWDVNYTRFNGTGIYNTQQAKQLMSANLFLPVHISALPITLQAGGYRKDYANYKIYNYNLGLNINFHQINISSNFNSYWLNNAHQVTGRLTRLSSAVSTNIFDNIYMRGALQYDFNQGGVENWSFMLSRRIFHWGYISADYRRNVQSNFGYLSLGIRFDLNKLHAYMSTQSYNNSISVSQSLQGSIGYDSNYHKFFLSNLPEVGSSDVSMRLFVDKNNNGKYDKGEKIIKNDAVRLLRTEQSFTSKSGVTRYVHLDAYRRYNAEINEAQITNPVLVPKFDKFSFVTDPNTYKEIDIPFYVTGVISGSVQSVIKSRKEPIPGLKLILRNQKGKMIKTLRTYSDGSFYSMQIRPGKYEIYVDSSQVKFLKSRSVPAVKRFKVKATSQGDFVDSLNFSLYPKKTNIQDSSADEDSELQKSDALKPSKTGKTEEGDRIKDFNMRSKKYSIQIGAFKNLDLALQAQKRGESILHREFIISYYPNIHLFKVFSSGVKDSSNAIVFLKKMSKTIYSDAFICKNRNLSLPNLKFSVQFGAYERKKDAQKMMHLVSKKLGDILKITRDTNPGYYCVRIKPMKLWEKAWKIKKEAVKDGFTHAFVTTDPTVIWLNRDYYYRIELGAFSTRKKAQKYAGHVYKKLGINSTIQKDSNNLYLVLLDKSFTWDNARYIQKRVYTTKGLDVPWVFMVEK